MPFRIVRNDITRVTADAVVNTANPEPKYGSGTDAAVYQAAGAEELLAARKKIGRISPGECAVTPAFRLPACAPATGSLSCWPISLAAKALPFR